MEMEQLKIISTANYRDGGTLSIKTNMGEFCIDGRIGSQTIGVMYSGYPDKSEITPGKIVFEVLRAVFFQIKNND